MTNTELKAAIPHRLAQPIPTTRETLTAPAIALDVETTLPTTLKALRELQEEGLTQNGSWHTADWSLTEAGRTRVGEVA